MKAELIYPCNLVGYGRLLLIVAAVSVYIGNGDPAARWVFLGCLTADLLLDLLDERAEVVEAPEGTRHTDDQLIQLASQLQCPVLTVDRELKRRLAESGAGIIEVVGSSTLRLVR